MKDVIDNILGSKIKLIINDVLIGSSFNVLTEMSTILQKSDGSVDLTTINSLVDAYYHGNENIEGAQDAVNFDFINALSATNENDCQKKLNLQ